MDHYKEIFDKYYSQFDNSEYWIKYKYDHTMRVVEYAKQIAISLNLSDEDVELAKLCGLFHDVSRFKQWAEYKTYVDLNSFDHGDMGYEILKELGIDNEIILISTKVHNKYEVPEELDDRNSYNTRVTDGSMNGKLPVSPVCNPGIDSIVASIEPTKHKYYYFVADKNGKTYFNETDSGHVKTVNKLKSEGLWIEYQN